MTKVHTTYHGGTFNGGVQQSSWGGEVEGGMHGPSVTMHAPLKGMQCGQIAQHGCSCQQRDGLVLAVLLSGGLATVEA